MSTNRRKLFQNIRRCYRIAQKLSPMWDDNAIPAKVAATSAMRQLTGKWDCCEPLRHGHIGGTFVIRKHPRLWVKRPFVSAACTRWLATH